MIFSDGVVEQHSPTGAAFGFQGVFDLLARTSTEGEDAHWLLEAVQSFAEADELSDDVTIASLRFEG